MTETFTAHKHQVQLRFISAVLNFKAEERHKNKWRTTDCVSFFLDTGWAHVGFQRVGAVTPDLILLAFVLL